MLCCVDYGVDVSEDVYGFIMQEYLPHPLSAIFRVGFSTGSRRKGCRPLLAQIVDPRLFGKRNGIVDEDVLMLLPSTDGDGYSLQYFVCVYPVDFNPPSQHWALSCARLTSSCLINEERDSLWAWTDT